MNKTFLSKGNRWGLIAILLVVLAAWYVYDATSRSITLRLGIYAGSSWDVQNGNEYKLIDQVIARFEQEHPRVRVVYESGVAKEAYSSWLSDTIVNGEQPDIFVLPENDFNLLASTGSLKKLNHFVEKDLRVEDFY